MKYYKFEKIKKGEYPIIRVTYKNWWGKLVVRDAYKSQFMKNYWWYMDNGGLIYDSEPIETFYKNDEDVYFLNKSS